MKVTYTISLLISAIFITSGCGKGSKNSTNQRISDSFSETVEIPISLTGGAASLLASAQSFRMSITNCVSGYTNSNITEQTSTVSVYKGDIDCVTTLNRFVTSSGVAYVWDASLSTSWNRGSLITFKNETNVNDRVVVSVVSVLSSPIQSSDAIKFSYLEISQGSEKTIAEGAITDSINLEVSGKEAPKFSISQASITSINSDGKPNFKFSLACDGIMVSGSCYSVKPTSVRYRLIAKDFSGELSVQAAAQYFSDPSKVSQVASSDVFETGNGGFLISSINGPDRLHSTSQLVLLLESDGSYRYSVINLELIE
jgi:hypothetical protein